MSTEQNFANILKFRFKGVYLLNCTKIFIMYMEEINNTFHQRLKIELFDKLKEAEGKENAQ